MTAYLIRRFLDRLPPWPFVWQGAKVAILDRMFFFYVLGCLGDLLPDMIIQMVLAFRQGVPFLPLICCLPR